MTKTSDPKMRQKILIGILIVAAIALGFFWYSGLQTRPSFEELISGSGGASLISEEKIKTIQLDLDVLDSSLFKSLKSHGVLPVTAGQTGRDNPFE